MNSSVGGASKAWHEFEDDSVVSSSGGSAASTNGLAVARTTLLGAVADFLAPPECGLCHVPIQSGAKLCGTCYSQLAEEYYCCRFCAAPLPTVVPNTDCLRCRGKRWRFQGVAALGPYSGLLREVVIDMKKPRMGAKRVIVAELLSNLVKSRMAGTLSDSVIVPVPNHWKHVFRPAADVAGQLASEIGRKTGIRVTNRAVRRIRQTDKQGMLAWSERANNVRGAFRIQAASELIGRHVFLIDDVFTSGATCAELARVLRRGGAKAVHVIVAARGTGIGSA